MLAYIIKYGRRAALRVPWRRLGAWCALVALCVTLLPVQAFATSTKKATPTDLTTVQNVEEKVDAMEENANVLKELSGTGLQKDNTFILQVETGVSPGNNVLYFGVRYKDEKGQLHTQFIYPHEGALLEGYNLFSKNNLKI